MKKYLMTWYGMTDFRASLGLEQTIGPVLGALLAEDYTDVVILGFTHPNKIKNKADDFQQKIVDIEDSNPAAVRQFIDLYSNTGDAHNHFNEWLKKQLRDAGKKVDVRFHLVELMHLNDTEGIYEAATQSLNAVAASEGEKLVTLYLSPGTPVMAFVWTFAALRYPTLKKRLIASSQPGKPPERIVLPNEWLEWHGRQVRTTNTESDQYDAIFHLFGEQRMPNLLGVIQFSSRKHIFLNSAQFPADVMKQFLGEAEYGEIAVDPYDPENVRSTVLDLIAKMPADAKIGFNLTGGTKLMYAGALAACRKVNATPFYFDFSKKQVINLNSFTKSDIVLINSVETFLKLNGDGLTISKFGLTEQDISPEIFMASRIIWDNRKLIVSKYRELKDYIAGEPFKCFGDDFYAELTIEKQAKLTIGKKSFVFEEFPEFIEFLMGKWLEFYIFEKLIPLKESGILKDIRLGLEVSMKNVDSNNNFKSYHDGFKENIAYQEFDVICTDGYCLFVIECKSGKVEANHILKLSEITKYFGGTMGQGIMISAFRPSHPVIKQKSDDLMNLIWFFGNSVSGSLLKFFENN
ncbi:Card1-like endonuclease domain-containing protein [Shewanella oncorhynchi]|uniref:Card1-like endonuclease domain-containing protein n=1 Tax=Shewanella oncorhynchi TaxID=2726434 RepID=UPI003D7A4E1A